MTPPKIIAFSRTRGAPVSAALQQRCVDRIVECHQILPTKMRTPTLSFDLRGTTAGQAFPGKHHIRLNGQLLNENVEEFIEQTVGHEWAHLVAIHLHGPKIRAHGPEWKNVMVKMGLDPARCHTYNTNNARTVKPRSMPKVKPMFKPTGTPVLPPKVITLLPPDLVIEIRVPGAVGVSTAMWAYANKLAVKKGRTLPSTLQQNQIMLMQWIELANQR